MEVPVSLNPEVLMAAKSGHQQEKYQIYARTKIFDDQPGYTCYDVLLDVLPDVEFWGTLCVPKCIKEG